MRNWLHLLLAACGAILLAILATTPPRPRPVDAPPGSFSAERAMRDIRAIAQAPRPTGSPGNAAARAHLVGRLRAMGLQTETVAFPLEARMREGLTKWSGAPARASTGVNIVATLPGRDRSLPALLLMAHHDSVWGSPGAADDGTGVAAILEATRAIVAGGRPRRDLIVLFTDAEELGYGGARAFFARDPRRGHIGAVINLEARGGGGRAAMFETGRGNGATMRLFAGAVRRPVATSLSVLIYELLPNGTDFTAAKDLGHQGLNFAFIGRPALYHSPLATADALDRGAVQDMGGQLLDASRALLDAPALPVRAPDIAFFDLFGLVLIHYAPLWGWGVLLLAVGGYAASVRRPAPGPLARGLGTTLLLVLASAALLFMLNLFSGAGGDANYYDRLAAIPRLQLQALLACLATLAAVPALLGPASRDAGFVAGMALPLLGLAAVLQAIAPTAGYLLEAPLLAGGIAAALGRFGLSRWPATLAAALGGGMMLGFGYFVLQAIAPDMPMVAALPLAVIAVLIAPLVPPLGRRTLTTAAATALIGAAAVALWVRFDAVAASIPAYSLRGVY